MANFLKKKEGWEISMAAAECCVPASECLQGEFKIDCAIQGPWVGKGERSPSQTQAWVILGKQ